MAHLVRVVSCTGSIRLEALSVSYGIPDMHVVAELAHPKVVTGLHPLCIIIILIARIHMSPIRPPTPILLLSALDTLPYCMTKTHIGPHPIIFILVPFPFTSMYKPIPCFRPLQRLAKRPKAAQRALAPSTQIIIGIVV